MQLPAQPGTAFAAQNSAAGQAPDASAQTSNPDDYAPAAEPSKASGFHVRKATENGMQLYSDAVASGGLPELRRRFGGWHRPVPALLEAAEPGAVLHHDLYDLPRLETYRFGKVVLTGDAAHAMTPNLGQGACQALEDAVVLGNVVAGADGLGAYDRQRRPRTQLIARRSRQIGAAAQWESQAAVSLRNAAMRLLPASSFARSIAPILDWAA